MRRAARAFTLIELLVVVGIVGLLLGTMLPSFVAVTDLAKETTCINNLNLVSKAIWTYFTQHNDLLPLNEPNTVQYSNFDANDMLPGQDSTPRWWCNKVYKYGNKRPDVYHCPSDPDRGMVESVECGYGFNDTLTDKDKVVTPYQVRDSVNTALVGHCSWINKDPAIVEEMVTPADWPRGHMNRYDPVGKEKLGRCGFLMADGHVRTRTFSEAVALKHVDGRMKLFRK
jgi:prepilin-type N-terminal cleavage/methylation domain-containing protein/prepilin-type processing-associated H-X9-DG protein